MTQARFNCPDVPPPLDFVARYPTLYRFCISGEADCDCYEAPHPTYPLRYHPVCDMDGTTDRNDRELLAALRNCENTCSCYGGPPENWSRWTFGPGPVGASIPITQLQNGYGTTTHSTSDSDSDSEAHAQAQAQAQAQARARGGSRS